MMDNSLAYIDYYLGAYGKNFLVHTCGNKWMILPKWAIRGLLNDDDPEINICSLCRVVSCDSVSELALCKSDKESKRRESLRDKKRPAYALEWDQEVIKIVVGLIRGLLESSGSSHYYQAEEESTCIIKSSFGKWAARRDKISETTNAGLTAQRRRQA